MWFMTEWANKQPLWLREKKQQDTSPTTKTI